MVSPEKPPSNLNIEPFVVDSAGNAYDEFTREKEVIIRSERLDAKNPVVCIDLETIIAGESGLGISIVIQDFGLPARLINVTGDFVSMLDLRGIAHDDEHYAGAPKHLNMWTVTPDSNNTYIFDDKGLPIEEYRGAGLSLGQSMLWAHDGKPSDERTGYIKSDWQELTALLPHDYYGSSNFSDVGEANSLRRAFVPYIGMSYKNAILSIHSLDDAHAEVQYQQVRSLADEMPSAITETFEVIKADALIAGLVKGDAAAQEILKSILEARIAAFDTVNDLKTRIASAMQNSDNLETMLVSGKRKLSDARAEAARLDGEVRRLQREAQAAGRATNQKTSDFLRDILGGRHSTEADPYGHCQTIGLDASFLFSLNPDTAAKIVKGVHRGLATQLHSDKGSEGSDEPMKAVNVAVDSILSRIEQGYWGRH